MLVYGSNSKTAINVTYYHNRWCIVQMEMKTTSQIEIGFEFHELTLDSGCGINTTHRFILKTTTECAITVFPHQGPGGYL